jgi:drug/metabolite transporter (DMT)-like permease
MMVGNPLRGESQRLRDDLILLMVSLIWGSAFVAQRVAATSMNVFLFNGLRFLLGAIVLIPLASFSSRRQEYSKPHNPHYLSYILLAGVLLYLGASLQALGMRSTTAANAGFITGMYVVLVPLLLALIWRQWPRNIVWPAVGLAATGLFLLSTGGNLRLAPGDRLEFGGAILWAGHVILIGFLAQRVEALPIAIGQNLVCGFLSLLTLLLTAGGNSWVGFSTSWWTIVYTGILSVGIGYTLQIVGQRVAPATDAAIIMSMEAVFAAIFGWILLSEYLSGVQILGCLLMVVAMVLVQIGPGRRGMPTLPEVSDSTAE